MGKGKFKNKLKEGLGIAFVAIAILAGRCWYQQHKCVEAAQDVFASIQAKAFSDEDLKRLIEVKDVQIEKLVKRYPHGGFAAKAKYWVDWVAEGVCECDGTGKVTFRNKRNGSSVQCDYNLMVKVTDEGNSLRVEVEQQMDEASAMKYDDFIKALVEELRQLATEE